MKHRPMARSIMQDILKMRKRTLTEGDAGDGEPPERARLGVAERDSSLTLRGELWWPVRG